MISQFLSGPTDMSMVIFVNNDGTVETHKNGKKIYSISNKGESVTNLIARWSWDTLIIC